jgi:leukotriene-A4 hydrolase
MWWRTRRLTAGPVSGFDSVVRRYSFMREKGRIPTLQVSVVAIVPSPTPRTCIREGNLVTNHTWEHFWLNEGWTVFLERKIMSEVNGDGRYFDFAAIAGWADLADSVALLPDEHTKLVPALGDGDPDDAFSSVPYEKGFNLLYALERVVGEGKFAGFVRAYFDRFKFSTVTTRDFVEYLELHFEDDGVALAGIKEFDWETWLHKPGMPELPYFDRTLSAECERLADAWISADDGTSARGSLPELDMSNWPSKRKTCFLDSLLEKCTERKRPLSLSTVAGIKETYAFHRSQNSEILFRFCILAVQSGDVSVLPVVVRFITSQGRMKFVRPLYRALFQSAMGKELAVSTFIKNRDFYHPIAAKMIATDLDELTKKAKEYGCGGMELKKILKKPMVVGGVLALTAAIGIALLRGKRR